MHFLTFLLIFTEQTPPLMPGDRSLRDAVPGEYVQEADGHPRCLRRFFQEVVVEQAVHGPWGAALIPCTLQISELDLKLSGTESEHASEENLQKCGTENNALQRKWWINLQRLENAQRKRNSFPETQWICKDMQIYRTRTQ